VPAAETDRRPGLRAGVIVAGVLGFLALVLWAAQDAGDGGLSVVEACLLGLIEGITEYLPVSSTGHLAVTQDLMGLADTPRAEQAADAYAIAIQAGAILAVAGLYRERLASGLVAVFRPTRAPASSRRLMFALAAAFVPAGLVAFAVGDVIKERLFGSWPTVAAWFVGGVVILVWDRKVAQGQRDLDDVTILDGLVIGIVQVLALWPGVSRSLVTILAGIGRRFSTVAAVEFSFLLGFVTLGIATVYEAIDSGEVIVEQFGLMAPLMGFGAALVSAAAAIVWLVRYLQEHGLSVFGWYRIGVAVAVGSLLTFTDVL
jgi:undecaprenyl-diphosphatase